MKVKLNETIKGIDGEPLVNPDPKHKGEFLTLKNFCINSLLTPVENEDEKKKWEKYELYKRLRDEDEVDLKAEDIVLIKKFLGKFQPQLIMGQCFELLDQ